MVDRLNKKAYVGLHLLLYIVLTIYLFISWEPSDLSLGYWARSAWFPAPEQSVFRAMPFVFVVIFFKAMYDKKLLDLVFVISGIVEVSVGVISLNTALDLDWLFWISQKPHLIWTFLYIASVLMPFLLSFSSFFNAWLRNIFFGYCARINNLIPVGLLERCCFIYFDIFSRLKDTELQKHTMF